MVIFEGEELLLHYHKGNSDYILITFASADQNEKAAETYFLQPIVEKYNLSCLGITAKFDNYYQHFDIHHIIALCNEITQNYQKILITGLSMGAYAALKFSGALRANIVFAMGVRYTLDKNVASISGIMQRSVERFDMHSLIETTIQPDDVSGKLYIAHDSYDGTSGYNQIDHEHAGKIIKNLPNTVLVPVLFAHHLVVNSLKGSEEFKSILDVLVTENDADIIWQVSRIRRHHINNIYNKVILFRKRYPLWIYKLLISQAFAKVKNNDRLCEDHQNNLLIIYHLSIKGYQKEACHLLRLCFLRGFLKYSFYDIDQMDKGYQEEVHTTSVSGHLSYLIAHSAYMLVFDQVEKKIIAMRSFNHDNRYLPLRIYEDQTVCRVVCAWQDILFELRYVDDSFYLSLLSLKDITKDHLIVKKQQNIATLYLPNSQHCLQIGLEGNSKFGDYEPKEWEKFVIV